MKTYLLILSYSVGFFFIVHSSGYAHPGRTDASGGHTCRSNCSSYGYSYGSYHRHSGGSSSSSLNQLLEEAEKRRGQQRLELEKLEEQLNELKNERNNNDASSNYGSGENKSYGGRQPKVIMSLDGFNTKKDTFSCKLYLTNNKIMKAKYCHYVDSDIFFTFNKKKYKIKKEKIIKVEKVALLEANEDPLESWECIDGFIRKGKRCKKVKISTDSKDSQSPQGKHKANKSSRNEKEYQQIETLIANHSKRDVIDYISKERGAVTIKIEGKYKKHSFGAPASEYVTIKTIRHDLNDIGKSTAEVDKYLTKIKTEAKAKEERMERMRIRTAKPWNSRNSKEGTIGKEPTSRGDISALSSSNPISRIGRVRAKADLKANLFERYGNNYSTIEMLLTSGMKAYDTLGSLPSNSVNNGILLKLKNRYYPSFSAILMLYKSNIESYNKLNNL